MNSSPLSIVLITIGLGTVLALLFAYVSTLRNLAQNDSARRRTAHGLPAHSPTDVKASAEARSASDASWSPISILKPLKGVEQGLEENLRALFEQDYPIFEVLFAAEDNSDPALEVARRVSAEFPERPVRILGGRAAAGLNPKVRLLQVLEQLASFDLVLVSDSNVRPGPHYLRALAWKQRQTGAALVHSLLGGSSGQSLGARLEDMQLSGWIAASVSFTDRYGDPVVIGKSMLLERHALSEVGGFPKVSDILAEDYILGRRLRQAGHTVALCADPLQVITSGRGIKDFFNRHVRWGQMQRTIHPLAFFVSLLAQPLPFLVVGAALAQGPWRCAALGILGFKWTAELFVARRVAGRLSPWTAALLPLKEGLFVAVWCTALVKRTVHWRGNRMLVGSGSRLLRLEPGAHLRRVRISP